MRVGRPPRPLHGLPAASTNAVCPACLQLQMGLARGRWAPPSAPGHRVGEEQEADRAVPKMEAGVNNAHTYCRLWRGSPLLWRTRQLLATCLPPLRSLHLVHRCPSSTTRDSLRFRSCRAGRGALLSASSASISLLYFTSLGLELAFFETLGAETLSRMARHRPASAAISSPPGPPERARRQRLAAEDHPPWPQCSSAVFP